MGGARVADVSIEDPPLEDIIAAMYPSRGEWPRSSASRCWAWRWRWSFFGRACGATSRATWSACAV